MIALHQLTGSFVAGLFQGLRHPSRGALLGALAVTVASLAAAASLITEHRVATAPADAWINDPADDYGRLTPRVLRGPDTSSNRLTVWILGASDTREALLGEAGLTRLLHDAHGGPVRAVSLCADGLLLEERAAIIDRLRPPAHGVIVLGINLNQFCRPVEDLKLASERYRLGFRSEVFDTEAALAGVTVSPATGHFFYDNRLFFLRRVGLLIPFGHTPAYVEHRSRGTEGIKGDPWAGRLIPHFSREEFNRHAALVSRLAERNRKANGPPIVLLEIPRLDTLEPRLGGPNHAGELALYREELGKFATREGLTYLDPAANAALGRDSFADPAHLGDDPARARFSAAFVSELLPLLPSIQP